ncbi:hypothetical protein Plhal703r1_c31g0122351 [Plasmopara halstedii]
MRDLRLCRKHERFSITNLIVRYDDFSTESALAAVPKHKGAYPALVFVALLQRAIPAAAEYVRTPDSKACNVSHVYETDLQPHHQNSVEALLARTSSDSFHDRLLADIA